MRIYPGFLLLFWMSMVLEHTEASGSAGSGLDGFFSGIRPDEADLVILMDRSLAVGRHDFYSKQKTLIHDVILYHLRVKHDSLRIAIATFANTVDVIIDGISQGKPRLTKCDLLNDHTGALWNDVIYKVTYKNVDGKNVEDYSDVSGVNINDALTTADNILKSGRDERHGVKQFVLLVTSAGWTSSPSPWRPSDSGVQLYAVGIGSGVESRLGKLRGLVQEADRERVQLHSVWVQHVFTQPKLLEVLEHADFIGKTDSTCSNRGRVRYCEIVTAATDCTIFTIQGCDASLCQNGGTCFQSQGPDSVAQCVCPPGKQGRYCENDIDECSMPDVCYPGSECENHENRFLCVCPGCDNPYCDCTSPPPPQPASSSDGEDDGQDLTWLYVLIPVLLILGLLIAAAVAYYCYRRRKRTQSPTSHLNTQSQRPQNNLYTGSSKPPGGTTPEWAVADGGKGAKGVDSIYENTVDDYDEINYDLEKGNNIYEKLSK